MKKIFKFQDINSQLWILKSKLWDVNSELRKKMSELRVINSEKKKTLELWDINWEFQEKVWNMNLEFQEKCQNCTIKSCSYLLYFLLCGETSFYSFSLFISVYKYVSHWLSIVVQQGNGQKRKLTLEYATVVKVSSSSYLKHDPHDVCKCLHTHRGTSLW